MGGARHQHYYNTKKHIIYIYILPNENWVLHNYNNNIKSFQHTSQCQNIEESCDDTTLTLTNDELLHTKRHHGCHDNHGLRLGSSSDSLQISVNMETSRIDILK